MTDAQQAVADAAAVVQQWLDETREAQARLDSFAEVGAAILDNPSTLGETASQKAALEQRIVLCRQASTEAQERHMAARRALHGAEADMLQRDVEDRQRALVEHEAAVDAIVQQLKDLTGTTWQPYARSGTDGSYVRPATMADRMRHQITERQQEIDGLRAIASGEIDLAALDAAAAETAAREAEQAAYDQMVAERRVTFNELVADLEAHGVMADLDGDSFDVAEFDYHLTDPGFVEAALRSAGFDQREGVDREWRQQVLTVAGGCLGSWSFRALVRWMDATPREGQPGATYYVPMPPTGPDEAA
ncbi:hypothetical protein [Micropruina sp.]|uniref:hypothetical protein n=1 Tax=Micropruina sp. TaxID=2737536 RepID=UPI0039E2D5D6